MMAQSAPSNRLHLPIESRTMSFRCHTWLSTTPALAAALLVLASCAADRRKDGPAEPIPESWTRPTGADGRSPRVAVGPWFGWTLSSLAGGLQLAGSDLVGDAAAPPDPDTTYCGIYAAWLDGPDENPHAGTDRADHSLDNGTPYALGYVILNDKSGQLLLDLTRESRLVNSNGTITAVIEGIYLKLNLSGDAGTWEHTVTVLPAVAHEAVLVPGERARVDWFLPAESRRPPRVVKWTTDAPFDLSALDVKVPDPYSPNDPTRAVRFFTHVVSPAAVGEARSGAPGR
ncbi:MAG: hypothetical protein AB7K09_16800 [Planctomycetota bacterium]